MVRGIGWQRVGAITNLGAYYTVGLPVALISVFVIKLDAGVRVQNPSCNPKPVLAVSAQTQSRKAIHRLEMTLLVSSFLHAREFLVRFNCSLFAEFWKG